MESTVTISSKEYARLQTRREQLNMLLTSVVRTAKLNWTKDGLVFDSEIIDLFLSVICPEERMDKLDELKRGEGHE